ncbi:MAG TPA: hypothetical protein VJR47_00375 [Stellaceae bacterium]|nr:hypothetical protein [Stellaceae bacterium]
MAKRKRGKVDLEKALLDPASSFEKPDDVLASQDLELRAKIEILCRWAYDAVELSVAEEEGMTGGEASNFGAVIAALHRATGGFNAERSGPTKHASFCAL